jgi:flavin reductase (DIM6/NTAB) family NADH-FMN oxidoreductase RutF
MMDEIRFRRIMGHFATGVTVVTTAVEGWLHGMTANAFASLSLDPLLVLVCVTRTAYTHDHLSRSTRFGVSMLTEEQRHLSVLFAEKRAPERDGLRGVPFHFGPHGMPILDGCVAYAECEVVDRLPGGDHTIFVGEVIGGDVLSDIPPLLYFRGTYRRMKAK